MKDILIVGSGGCAREVHQIIEDINRAAPTWTLLGFVDDNPALHGGTVHGYPVLGGIGCDALAGAPDAAVTVTVAVGIGSPPLRRRIVGLLRRRGVVDFATLIHPGASIGARVTIGQGSMIWPGAVVTTDVTLGEQVIVNAGSTISHDAVLGDYATLAPAVSLAGAVRVGEGVDLGIGARVIQGITIMPWSIIGAGAVVIAPVDANVTAVGVPARTIKTRKAGWHLEIG